MARRRRKQRGLRGSREYHLAQVDQDMQALRRAIKALEKAPTCSQQAFDNVAEGWIRIGSVKEHLMPQSSFPYPYHENVDNLMRELARLQYRKIKACSVR